MMNCKGPN